jgi:dipeptidyl aminopeptidase/acylaminoacyl peptidase
MLRRVINLVLTAIVSVVVFGFLGIMWLAWWQASMLVNPVQNSPTATPANVGITAFQDITLTTSDGLSLTAWYVPPPAGSNGAIIYTHGIGSRRDHWLTEMRRLYDAGYGAILFDFRNHGDSQGEVTTMGVQEVEDVRAALDFLLNQPDVDPDRIMLVGDSFGASSGLLAVAELPQIAGVAALSPYSSILGVVGDRAQKDFRLPPRPSADLVLWWAGRMGGENYYQAAPVDVMEQIAPRPVWLIHGEFDPVTPPISSQRLYDALGGEAGNVELWIVSGGGHGTVRVTHAAEFQQRLIDFVDSVIGPSAG